MKIPGTVALVTGGANDIGRAVALKLAERGATGIAIHYLSSEAQAKEAAALVEKAGAQVILCRANIGVESDVRAMVDDVTSRFGRLDVLVNNAATRVPVDYNDLEALTDGAWEELYRINVLGPFYAARAAAAALRAARGAIVNVTSIAGHRSVGSSLHYGVSKAALLQLTRGLARAMAPEIRVNSVSPGTVDTRWHRGLHDADFDAWHTAEISRMPLGRLVLPGDIAQTVIVFVENDIVTGQDVIADAGRHLLY